MKKFDMPIADFVKMKINKSMSNASIAKEMDVAVATIYNWAKEHKDEINAASGIVTVRQQPKEQPVADESDLKFAIEKLKKDKSELEETNESLKQENDNHKEINRRLRERMDDLNNTSISKINEYKEKYEREKEAHRKLFEYMTLMIEG